MNHCGGIDANSHLGQAADCVRSDLSDITEQTFQRWNAAVTQIGSMRIGRADAFSDLDVWVAVPDCNMTEVVSSRHETYRTIGSLLLSWERPRFAPVGGVHSIVLYDDPRLAIPAEIDFYVASETGSKPYANFINLQQTHTQHYEWGKGDDDSCREAVLSYCALVTLWASKYYARGDSQKLQWAVERYKQSQQQVDDLPRLNFDSCEQPLRPIVQALISSTDNTLQKACYKIKEAVAIADLAA